MVLKSYRLMFKKKKNKPVRRKMRRSSLTGDIITGGVGALVGVAIVSQTADVLSSL